MEFDYFYKRDLERFQFFMLPKILVMGEQFKTISSDAKILYACLFDRISLSAKNDWLDEEGRIYIIFTIEEIMKTINRSRPTAVKALDELDKNTGGIGLIERKRLGFGKPNIIYVKDFTSYRDEKLENQTTNIKLKTDSHRETRESVFYSANTQNPDSKINYKASKKAQLRKQAEIFRKEEKLAEKASQESEVYDPLAKDTDNDGIPDRYDNNFTTSL